MDPWSNCWEIRGPRRAPDVRVHDGPSQGGTPRLIWASASDWEARDAHERESGQRRRHPVAPAVGLAGEHSFSSSWPRIQTWISSLRRGGTRARDKGIGEASQATTMRRRGRWRRMARRRVLTHKRRIPLRSVSVWTPHLFHHGIPKVLVNPWSKGITSVRSTTTH
jgi:hypothetical protein